MFIYTAIISATSWSLYSTFASRSFRYSVSVPAPFTVELCSGEETKTLFHFFMCRDLVSPIVFVEDVVFTPLCIFGISVKNQEAEIAGNCICIFYFILTSYRTGFM